jgi:SAM-dependent methyltransferase
MATQVKGSADVQGDLWSERAEHWPLQERGQRAQYEATFDAIGLGEGTRLLDAGCGAGTAASIAARRGAVVTGIDAAPALIELARERVPSAEFHVGELEALMFADDAFDAVVGFNSFQYATTPVNALREARRVARSGAPVAIATWGAAERCEAAGYLKALGSLLPPPPPGAPGPFALSAPGALEALVEEAGLTPAKAFDVEVVWEYADDDEMLRAFLSGGPPARAIREAGEQAVRAAIDDAIGPYRTSDGAYRLENVFRVLVSTA